MPSNCETATLKTNDSPKSDDDKIGRRQFMETTGTVAVAAASWWALTEKTEALAVAQRDGFIAGGDPGDQNYDYNE